MRKAMLGTKGILADNDIARLYDENQLQSDRALDNDQIQPSSLDLRLGEVAYRMRASFLPGKNASVAEKIAQHVLHELPLADSAVFETGCVYLVPLLERLSLSNELSAVANPKSSTGRLDIFTRLITDNAQEFDKVTSGYHGPLYLEISPQTFPIVARTGSRLSQIRFRMNGAAYLSMSELGELHRAQSLVSGELAHISPSGVGLSIDLTGDQSGLIGYRGKRHTGVIDVDKRNYIEKLDFWEPIYRRSAPELILDPNEFYILVSREAVHIPPLYAAEMTPFDPLIGEFRVHYAGFFDPGFGSNLSGGVGSRAVLEVRSHEVPFILEHGQIIGHLVYEKMLSRPSILYGQDAGSNYQAQGLKLSKHFREN